MWFKLVDFPLDDATFLFYPAEDEDTKESIDEYEKDERLDLEDNEPEYEPEEYGVVDYDEKEIEPDPHEDVGEVEEDPEELDVGEEEGDVVEEEMDSIHEELEHEEDDDHVGREQTEMGYAAEEEEHHEVFKERRKRKEFEIFVGGLDKDATEADLRKVFSEVGEVTEVRLMMNPQTKKNKGFAFLRFATVEQARRACASLKNPVVLILMWLLKLVVFLYNAAHLLLTTQIPGLWQAVWCDTKPGQ